MNAQAMQLVDTVEKNTPDAITSFRGGYAFLSNFYRFPHPIEYGNIFFHTVEHAFQAAKTRDVMARQRIALASSPGIARQMGRMSQLRSDWDGVKLTIMKELVRQKFKKNSALLKSLVETGNAVLIEGNRWNETYWGMVWDASTNSWAGENHLGRILMEIRDSAKARLQDCEDGDC